MRIVLDTNVLISSLIKSGPPRELFSKITSGSRMWVEDVDTYWTQFRDLVSAVFGKAISNEATFPKVI